MLTTVLLQKSEGTDSVSDTIAAEVISGERIFVVVSTTSRDLSRFKCMTLRHGVPLAELDEAVRRVRAAAGQSVGRDHALLLQRDGAQLLLQSAYIGVEPAKDAAESDAYRKLEPETFEATSAFLGADRAALYEFLDHEKCPGNGVFAFIAGPPPHPSGGTRRK